MKPFNGKCEMPEQKVERGVFTICAKRSGYDLTENPVGPIDGLHGNANISPKGKYLEIGSHTTEFVYCD